MALTRATDKIIGDSNGNLNLSGIVTASSFVGSGSALTGVASTDNIKTSTTANFTDGINVVGLITATSGINLVGNDLNVGSSIKLGNASGIVTATTFSGSGVNLTNLPAANLTGTLPAISGANLTNLPAANITGTLPAISGASLTGVTAVGLSTTASLNTSGIVTATAFVPTVGQLSHRNLIVNGAMTVAQRGTSSTSTGYQTIDRIKQTYSGTDEAPTYAQVDVASGTTPYTQGFRKALKITNGNQTGGAGSSDKIEFEYKIEAQDMASSGWNYKSSSSFVTLSFWVKSSVSQNFNGYILSLDGTTQNFPFETGTLTADTWTKITKTIPGNSNIDFNSDNGEGLRLVFNQFLGTDQTGSVSLNAWAAFSGSTRTPNQTSTWYTTNDATWEITGLQLEVGSVATPFEHRSIGDEMHRCQRYFYMCADGTRGKSGTNRAPICTGAMYNASNFNGVVNFPVEMRTTPSLYKVVGNGYFRIWGNGGSDGCNDVVLEGSSPQCGIANIYDGLSQTSGSATWATTDNAACRLGFQAEL